MSPVIDADRLNTGAANNVETGNTIKLATASSVAGMQTAFSFNPPSGVFEGGELRIERAPAARRRRGWNAIHIVVYLDRREMRISNTTPFVCQRIARRS
jgi:hypothetical protein